MQKKISAQHKFRIEKEIAYAKNTVSDPITDQEVAFANLVLSGTMNDSRAAEAVGLNPDTAAYTKAKPRVRAYMIEHRAAVEEKLVNQEAEGLRKLNLGRDQILARLWELANLSPESTRNNIAGQIKALSMILAIEGLIPDRRLSAPASQTAAPLMNPAGYGARSPREQQAQAEDTLSADKNDEPETGAGHPQSTTPANPLQSMPPLMEDPLEATDCAFDATPVTADPGRQPFFPRRGLSGIRR